MTREPGEDDDLEPDVLLGDVIKDERVRVVLGLQPTVIDITLPQVADVLERQRVQRRAATLDAIVLAGQWTSSRLEQAMARDDLDAVLDYTEDRAWLRKAWADVRRT